MPAMKHGKVIDAQLARALKVYHSWSGAILPDFHLTFFCRYAAKDSKKHSYSTAMWVKPRWEYKRAAIYVVASVTADMADDLFEGAVIHELMHVRLAELGAKYSPHEERVCEDLTWAFMRTRHAERRACAKRAKKAAKK
jgi:hypothetical protein